ncbi:MAG: T9SS type A sorting domain-containing protein [Crocinitomicaceae bacterium]|nr:T9SS type A sorting domain-containing protein [Crocinitomicaceae bacterium]
MKKIYSVVLVLLVSSVAYSQWNVGTNPVKRTFSKSEISPIMARRQSVVSTPPAMRVELLNENFNGVAGPLPAALPAGWVTNTVTDMDAQNVQAFRVHNSTTANAGGYWPVPVTTPNNKFAGANDDSAPCDCDYAEAYLQTPELDFSAASNVALTFDIFHDRGFGGGDASVLVSTDGGTVFETMVLGVDDEGIDVTVLPVDVDYWQTIILPVYDLSGQSSVIFRFLWTDGGEWASGFAVDNVIVGELTNYDLKTDKVKFGNWNQETFERGVWDYTQVPLSQTSPVLGTAVIANNGFTDQANVSVSFSVLSDGNPVSGSPFSSDQVSANFLSLDKDTLSVVTNYTPSGLGTVSMTGTVSSNGADDVPANDAASNFMEITQYTYARDADAAQAFVQPDSDYEYGNLFDIYNDEAFGGVLFAPGGNSDVGAIVVGRVYEWNGLDGAGLPVLSDPVAETVEHSLEASEMNSAGDNNFIFLPFFDGVTTNALTLEGGKTYLVTIASAGDARVSVSGSNTWVVSWLFSSNGWGATLSIPMVRLSSDASLGVASAPKAEGLSLNQNMPNPAADYTIISYNLVSSERVSLTVRDMSGRIVSLQNVGLKTPGKQTLRLNVENLSSGVYSYTLTAGSESLTKQMMVK